MKILLTQKNYNQEQGFTITEVVVSALIFAVATAGVLATATTMRRPAVDSSEDVTAAFLAKRILDDLRSQLDSITWQNNGLFDIGKHYDKTNLPMLADIVVDGVTYRPSYDVVTDPNGTQARKIELSIDW